MIPLLGQFSIIFAFFFALIQGFKGRYTLGQFLFLSFAMFCLIICFITADMSVIYVREHSHRLLPLIYRIGAAWGGHEGSLLLWCLILSGWTVAFQFIHLNKLEFKNIIAILGWINAGFIAFLFLTSNPFLSDLSNSADMGNDLTPVLQDPGLIFHPPMLYMGYVGFAIGFAFAISALLKGQFSKEWAQACQPWIILPWSFLSCGIVLGSWWAYRELGWGGWWFWDPVENASLLPWLSATALIHSLIVCEKRNTFKGWAILLAILTFSLSLIGTFLVRSGVLVSVHAFASDPTRGIFLLAYLTFLIGGAFSLYAWRIKDFYNTPHFSLFSRETFLLLNSVILLTAVSTILLGTVYPIILDALNLDKISVGEPYFNTVFVPIMLPLLLLMGIAPHMNWGNQTVIKLWNKLGLASILSFILTWIMFKIFTLPFCWLTAIGIFVGMWIIVATIQFVLKQKTISIHYGSMIVAHLGIAIFVLGVTLNTSYSEEKQVKMQPGETVSLAGFQFTLDHLDETKGPNYVSIAAIFHVQKNQAFSQQVIAEQRIYAYDQTLGKTGILAHWWGDLYLALGSPLPHNAWSVRIYYKPFVRWIWFGGFLLLFGGLLSLLKPRGKNAII